MLVSVRVIQGDELKKEGLGLLWGVGKAAVNKSALIILSHTPSGPTPEGKDAGVAMCGKGIVYDTGGLSIKTKTGMPGMKRDMGGSAACLGSFVSLVRERIAAASSSSSSSSSKLHTMPLYGLLC